MLGLLFKRDPDGGLEWHKCPVSQFWRLEIWTEVSVGLTPPEGVLWSTCPRSWPSSSRGALAMFAPVSVSTFSPFHKDISCSGLEPSLLTSQTSFLTWFPLERSCFHIPRDLWLGLEHASFGGCDSSLNKQPGGDLRGRTVCSADELVPRELELGGLLDRMSPNS